MLKERKRSILRIISLYFFESSKIFKGTKLQWIEKDPSSRSKGNDSSKMELTTRSLRQTCLIFDYVHYNNNDFLCLSFVINQRGCTVVRTNSQVASLKIKSQK